MRIKTLKPVEFYNALAPVVSVVSELTMKVTKDGLLVGSIDDARVSLIHVEIPASFFDEFEVDDVESITVDAKKFIKILSKAKKGELEIKTKDNTVEVRMKNRKFTRTFTLGTFNSDKEVMSLPEISFTTEAIIDARAFMDALKDASMVDGDFILEYDGVLKLKAGEKRGTLEVEFDSPVKGEKAASKYNISLVMDIIKYSQTDDFEVRFGTGFPLELSYSSGDSKTTIIIAPIEM